jgi:hypothetical protein
MSRGELIPLVKNLLQRVANGEYFGTGLNRLSNDFFEKVGCTTESGRRIRYIVRDKYEPSFSTIIFLNQSSDGIKIAPALFKKKPADVI